MHERAQREVFEDGGEQRSLGVWGARCQPRGDGARQRDATPVTRPRAGRSPCSAGIRTAARRVRPLFSYFHLCGL